MTQPSPLRRIRPRAGLALAALCALAACQSDDPPPIGGMSVDPAVLQQACERDGGRWGRVPQSTAMVCYRDMPDANTACATGDECNGLCLARSRTCAPVAPLFGCHEILTSSGRRATRCIE